MLESATDFQVSPAVSGDQGIREYLNHARGPQGLGQRIPFEPTGLGNVGKREKMVRIK